jgi:hypothetical protein
MRVTGPNLTQFSHGFLLGASKQAAQEPSTVRGRGEAGSLPYGGLQHRSQAILCRWWTGESENAVSKGSRYKHKLKYPGKMHLFTKIKKGFFPTEGHGYNHLNEQLFLVMDLLSGDQERPAPRPRMSQGFDNGISPHLG